IQHSQVSEELQLTGTNGDFKWVTGAFFLSEHGSQLERTFFGTAFPNAVTSGPPGFIPVALGAATALNPPYDLGVPSESGADIDQRSYAVFGQATWRPNADKLSYTVGVRVG